MKVIKAILLTLLLISCMIKVADLRLTSPFVGESIDGGCRIHFSVINLGQKTARDAYIHLEMRDVVENVLLNEYEVYLGDIKAQETKQYSLEIADVEWGADIGFKETFTWR